MIKTLDYFDIYSFKIVLSPFYLNLTRFVSKNSELIRILLADDWL